MDKLDVTQADPSVPDSVDTLHPTYWYNIAADFPVPAPPHLNPATKEPVTEAELSALFASELAAQELSGEGR